MASRHAAACLNPECVRWHLWRLFKVAVPGAKKFAGRPISIPVWKARRDDISASVNFWVERITQKNPDGLTVNALVDEATNRVAKDREMEGVYPFVNFRNDSPLQPGREYWIGRNQTKTSARRAPMR